MEDKFTKTKLQKHKNTVIHKYFQQNTTWLRESLKVKGTYKRQSIIGDDS